MFYTCIYEANKAYSYFFNTGSVVRSDRTYVHLSSIKFGLDTIPNIMGLVGTWAWYGIGRSDWLANVPKVP